MVVGSSWTRSSNNLELFQSSCSRSAVGRNLRESTQVLAGRYAGRYGTYRPVQEVSKRAPTHSLIPANQSVDQFIPANLSSLFGYSTRSGFGSTVYLVSIQYFPPRTDRQRPGAKTDTLTDTGRLTHRQKDRQADRWPDTVA